ncbi:MAG TPA: HEAT repeat domain-containing protein [Thermoanaerobaculia bacterium]|nr:HEAT repeat domain-containing protein [Thermoanaerobaculia bacterium]
MRSKTSSATRWIAAVLLTAGAGGPAAAAAAAEVVGGTVREVEVAGNLARTLQSVAANDKGPLWLAWEVPAVTSLRNACCFDRSFRRATCHLEGRDQSWGSSGEGPGSGHLRVLARWAGGRVERVRAVNDQCPLDTGGLPFVHLSGVAPVDSVALLASLAERDGGRHDEDQPLAALAYHADRAADAVLQRLAAAGRPADRREQALFWIGQARGAEGARFLAGVARNDPSPDIREKAVFSLSQSDAAEATPAIVEVARRDESPHVRGEALFWLAQTGGESVPQVLLERLDADPSREVRKQAIFAITQLPDHLGTPLLMRIVRERRDNEIRKEALFWLGQSNDPRALDFLEKVLEQ